MTDTTDLAELDPAGAHAVTIVIPSIPSRGRMLTRAIASCVEQTHPPAAIITSLDLDGAGAWGNRNRGALHVRTPWCAFLDDDDELLPHHLATLLTLAETASAGLTWGWFDVVNGADPFPQHRGRPFDPAAPHIVPITYLVRTEVLLEAMAAVGGFAADHAGTGAWDVQDQPVFVAMAELGGTANTADTTWLWHHHESNTSGLPERVKA